MSKRSHELNDHIVFYGFLIVIVLLVGITVFAAGGRKVTPQCDDHIDNDGNGYCDYKSGGSYCKNGSVRLGDPGCSSKQDTTESSLALCGNNVIESGEICDGRSQSCTTSDGYPGTQQCNLQCNGWGTCTSTFYCGDGSVDGNETCDYNDLVSGTRGNCTTANGYAGSEKCDSYCSGYLCTSTQFCGDGVKNGPESCDGSDLGGTTCQTQGFTSGAISCTSLCTLDTSGCSNDNATNQTNATTTTPSCTDSDGGNAPFTAGTISTVLNSGWASTTSDYCTNNWLTEFYCDGATGMSAVVSCQYGCTNSACVAALPDLTVEEAWFIDANNNRIYSAKKGDPIYVAARIKNTGGATAAAPDGLFWTAFWGIKEPGSSYTPGSLESGALAVGESRELFKNTLSVSSAVFGVGAYCPRAEADSSSEITESNETNNRFNILTWSTYPCITSTDSCTPNWQCTAWSTCSSNGTQTRTCTDANNCGTTSGKPAESQTCTYSPNCVDTDGGINYGVQGTVTYNLNYAPEYQRTVTDSCSGSTLNEYSCTATGSVTTSYYTCPNGCTNGACT